MAIKMLTFIKFRIFSVLWLIPEESLNEQSIFFLVFYSNVFEFIRIVVLLLMFFIITSLSYCSIKY